MKERDPFMDPAQGDKLSGRGLTFVVDIVKGGSISFVKWRKEKPLDQAYGKRTLSDWRREWKGVSDAEIIERGDEVRPGMKTDMNITSEQEAADSRRDDPGAVASAQEVHEHEALMDRLREALMKIESKADDLDGEDLENLVQEWEGK